MNAIMARRSFASSVAYCLCLLHGLTGRVDLEAEVDPLLTEGFAAIFFVFSSGAWEGMGFPSTMSLSCSVVNCFVFSSGFCDSAPRFLEDAKLP